MLLATIQVGFDGFYLQHFLNSVSHLVPYMSSLYFCPGFISFPVHPFLPFFFIYEPYVSPSYSFLCFLISFLNLFLSFISSSLLLTCLILYFFASFLILLTSLFLSSLFQFLLTYKCFNFLPAFLFSFPIPSFSSSLLSSVCITFYVSFPLS